MQMPLEKVFSAKRSAQDGTQTRLEAIVTPDLVKSAKITY